MISCQPKENENISDNPISEQKPNIIIIYADDLGFGDVSAYQTGTLSTPNFDRIAEEGLRFTNGYATSATCTPSRYGLLTGQYPWRKRGARVLPGNAPLIIDTAQTTLPKMLKKGGYTTAVIGKWHLGLGSENLDWNGEISPGPNEVGFDYSYIMASTNDRSPTVYVENDRVFGLVPEDDPLYVNYKENFPGEPTGRENPQLLKMHFSHGHDFSIQNGISRIGYMKGGHSARWIDEDMNDTLVHRTKKFIINQKDKPFFLFYSLYQPHVPRVPHQRFAGKSGLGPRGDVILEADWAVGEVLDLLDSLQLLENTLIFFSSDNGPVLDDGYFDSAVDSIGDHTPWGPLRGGKYSLFEAGARVPFITMWKGKIVPGVSEALVSQVDYLASLSSLLQIDYNLNDSKNVLPALLGESPEGRDHLVVGRNQQTYIRQEKWVMIPPHDGPKMTNKWVNIETGKSPEYQLYDLEQDPGQLNNLAEQYPDLVNNMDSLLRKIKK